MELVSAHGLDLVPGLGVEVHGDGIVVDRTEDLADLDRLFVEDDLVAEVLVERLDAGLDGVGSGDVLHIDLGVLTLVDEVDERVGEMNDQLQALIKQKEDKQQNVDDLLATLTEQQKTIDRLQMNLNEVLR